MGRVQEWQALFFRWIDLKAAVAGALVMGSIVWWVNIGSGPMGAGTAALKQATYTFLAGGFVMRMCERLALAIRATVPAVLAATGLPSLVAVGATAVVHHLRGTPHPVASTIPTAIIAPASFLAWALLVRRRRQRASES